MFRQIIDHISIEEQQRRLLERLNQSEKNWKFSKKDIHKREYWNECMQDYEEVFLATSRSWAPWDSIPADNKSFACLEVAQAIVKTLRCLDFRYPDADLRKNELDEIRKKLKSFPK